MTEADSTLTNIAMEWFRRVSAHEPECVVALYHDDLSFHPTLSGKFIRNLTATREYFDDFLRKEPAISIRESAQQNLGENIFIFSGNKSVELNCGDERKTVMVRFSFLWQRQSDKTWRIVHHHNSIQPEVNPLETWIL